MRKAKNEEQNAYDNIMQRKEKFGTYHKSCFHIHTPESYDYTLLAEWKSQPQHYRDISDEEMLSLCKREKVLLPSLCVDDIDLNDELTGFISKKEAMAFLLTASSLFQNGIEMAVVCDHHTIQGVNKLRKAIKYLSQHKSHDIYPEVLLGIEISCADKNHVVGIFNDTEGIRKKIDSWLEENLVNIEVGSFRTSLDVLEFIRSTDGIGYIAHIDSSDIFKSGHLSGAYKGKLFSDNNSVIGLAKLDQRENIQSKIKNYSPIKAKFVLDNDSHDFETLAENCFWIKGSKSDFATLRESFIDYEISVSLVEQSQNVQYIKGIFIEEREGGFLCGKPDAKDKGFCLDFSSSLNCIIGGRGTGKSSILKVLEFVLSQHCKSEGELEFMCSHGNTWMVYVYKGQEYLICMRMPIKETHDNILKCFGQNPTGRYKFHYHFEADEISAFAMNRCIEIYKVMKKEGNDIFVEEEKNKRKLLNDFFDTAYSINELVNTASGSEINHFLYQTLFKNHILASMDTVRVKSKAGVKKYLHSIKDVMEKRRQEVSAVIAPFNLKQKGILRIVYSQDRQLKDPPLADWLFGTNFAEEKRYKQYNITQGNIVEFLLSIYDRMGIWEFLNAVMSNNVADVSRLFDLTEYCTDMTATMVEKGVHEIQRKDSLSVIQSLFNKLGSDNNIPNVIEYLKDYAENVEEFKLEFNVNNREGGDKVIYKDVKTISLGQKVVAMLSFILGYSEYSEDFRPLIIDQPEDNLDNQYIYKNLVTQLKQVKGERQVIIATHNATIVTNAKADQVCVMDSDNQNGWVKRTGYIGETKIKKEIINYLEGGADSFLHKMNLYREALK